MGEIPLYTQKCAHAPGGIHKPTHRSDTPIAFYRGTSLIRKRTTLTLP